MSDLLKLTKLQLKRYQQQLALPSMNESIQLKFLRSKVVVLGLDSLSTVCASYLAAAGIGKLVLADPGYVEPSHLCQQILFAEADSAQQKVIAANQRLKLLNSDIEITNLAYKFDAHNAESILSDCSLVVDGLESWQDKLLASDVCMQMRKPLIHGGMIAFTFQVYTMMPGFSACLRCVFAYLGLEDFPQSKGSFGIYGPAAGMAGAFQANQVLKLLGKLGTTPANQLLRFDALRQEFETITNLKPRADCPDCGSK